MNQLTLKELYNKIGKALKNNPSWGDKLVITGDDNKGNSYHGVYYGVTGDPEAIQEILEVSNGLTDSQTEDVSKIVIIG